MKNFRENDVFDVPNLEEKTVNFSYEDGDQFVFLDADSEQIYVGSDVIGEKKYFLDDDMECRLLFLDGNPVDITLPTWTQRRVVSCGAGAKGNTSAGNATKDAEVEGGYTLKVPLFVEEGDLIRIDTRDGSYNDRVKG